MENTIIENQMMAVAAIANQNGYRAAPTHEEIADDKTRCESFRKIVAFFSFGVTLLLPNECKDE